MDYRIVEGAENMSIEEIARLLGMTYWANHRTLAQIEKSVRHSACYGIRIGGEGTLAGFARVNLAPGEEKRVRIDYHHTALTVVNDQGERVSGGPTFSVYASLTQPDPRSTELTGQAPLAATLKV